MRLRLRRLRLRRLRLRLRLRCLRPLPRPSRVYPSWLVLAAVVRRRLWLPLRLRHRLHRRHPLRLLRLLRLLGLRPLRVLRLLRALRTQKRRGSVRHARTFTKEQRPTT